MNSCRTPRFVVWAILLCLLLGAACQHKAHVISAETGPLHFKRILVMPFADLSVFRSEDVNSRCPVCGRTFVAGPVESDATGVLTEHLMGWLRTNTNYEIEFAGESSRPISSPLLQDGGLRLDRNMLMAAGWESQTDAVLVGYVYRYIERVGGKYTASSPASVAFGLHLIQTADGRSVWQGHYDETQGTLLNNLFQLGTFLRRKGQWVSAETMATGGLDQILANFPKS